MSQGGNVTENVSFFHSDQTRTSPLFLAAQNGDIDTLRLLLKYGAELDQPNCVSNFSTKN